jgi:hypothetical protein
LVCGERQESRLGQLGFVVSRGNAPERFQPAEHALDAVSNLVRLEVASGRIGTVCPGRNDRGNAFQLEGGSYAITIGALSANMIFGLPAGSASSSSTPR